MLLEEDEKIMAAKNRAKVIEKLHRVLRKHYKAIACNNKTVLETLTWACCLEDASYQDAQRALEAIQEEFFDWNDVRVATIKELAGVISHLPDPQGCAQRLRTALQHLFESRYSFDLEWLRKEKLGKVSKYLEEKLRCTPFVTAYVMQNALGGHAIAVDKAAWEVFRLLGLTSEKDQETRRVPGLERAVPKTKGREFVSLLHQFAVDWAARPNSTTLRKILEEVDPEVKAHWKKTAATTTKATATKRKRKTAAAKTAKTAKGAKTTKKVKTATKKARRRSTPRKPR